MRVISNDEIEVSRVVRSIGTVKAASAWHASDAAPLQGNWRDQVLRDLMRAAEDIDADAIIGVDYVVDPTPASDESGIKLQRILATGIAVRLSCAA